MEQKVIEDICCELSKDLLGLQFPGKLKVGNYYVSFQHFGRWQTKKSAEILWF